MSLGAGSDMMAYRPCGADLSGRIALVTGANSGMGKETARELARMGAGVILACRSTARGQAAAQEIIATTGRTGVTVMKLDLSSLASVRTFVQAFRDRFPKLDVLVNNAAASLRTRELTCDGFERQWATNVLGPHLLTKLLLPALEASGAGRIVTVSTVAAGGLDLSDPQYEKRRYSGIGAYRASKQASRMLTWSLADRLKAAQITANALNPGYVRTNLTTNVGGPLKIVVALTGFRAQTALDGADTAIWLAASRDVEGVTGKFWNNRHEARCRFRDPAGMEQLWTLVEHQTARTVQDEVP
ncbi:MAG TPA: SDR family NAD(P)-dependent oxidoreductase [Jatrophihabitans sp.]|nr:SDR family NAD(P)-dependent oxidoreductase [Jatrophihabitans sp.]